MRPGQETEAELSRLPGVQLVKAGASEYVTADLAWNGYEIELKSHAKSGVRQVTVSLRDRKGRVENWSLEKFETAVTYYHKGAGAMVRSMSTLEGLIQWAINYGEDVIAGMRGKKDGRCTFIRKVIQTLRADSKLPASQRPEKPVPSARLRIQHVAWLLGQGVTVEQVKRLKNRGLIRFQQTRARGNVVYLPEDIEEFLEKHGAQEGFSSARFQRWMQEFRSRYDSIL